VFPAAICSRFFNLSAAGVNYGASGVIGQKSRMVLDDPGRQVERQPACLATVTAEDEAQFQARPVRAPPVASTMRFSCPYDDGRPASMAAPQLAAKTSIGDTRGSQWPTSLPFTWTARGDQVNRRLNRRPAFFMSWPSGGVEKPRRSHAPQMAADPHSPPIPVKRSSCAILDAWYVGMPRHAGQCALTCPEQRIKIW